MVLKILYVLISDNFYCTVIFLLTPSSYFSVTLTIVYRKHIFLTSHMVCHFSLLPLIYEHIQEYNIILYCTTLGWNINRTFYTLLLNYYYYYTKYIINIFNSNHVKW